MREWLAEIAEPQYVEAILWTLGALAALVVLLLVVRLARGLRGGTFVAGGRNRRTRLAVMDATAIDTHRRLVLVRRDDVEHLLLIGGPTDVVVEQSIRLHAPQRRTAGPREASGDLDAAAQPAAAAQPERPPEIAPPRPAVAAPQRSAPAPTHFTPARAAEHPAPGFPNRSGHQAAPPPAAPQPVRPVQPRSEPPRPDPPWPEETRSGEPKAATAPPRPRSPNAQQPARRTEPDDMDEALMRELEVSFDELEPSPAERRTSSVKSPSLDDEMTRLLGELSSGRR